MISIKKNNAKIGIRNHPQKCFNTLSSNLSIYTINKHTNSKCKHQINIWNFLFEIAYIRTCSYWTEFSTDGSNIPIIVNIPMRCITKIAWCIFLMYTYTHIIWCTACSLELMGKLYPPLLCLLFGLLFNIYRCSTLLHPLAFKQYIHTIATCAHRLM